MEIFAASDRERMTYLGNYRRVMSEEITILKYSELQGSAVFVSKYNNMITEHKNKMFVEGLKAMISSSKTVNGITTDKDDIIT